MRFIDLFAGLGGFHLALSRLGHECVFASEIQPKLQKLYQLNFPHTPIAGDMARSRDLTMSWGVATCLMRFAVFSVIIILDTSFWRTCRLCQGMMGDALGR